MKRVSEESPLHSKERWFWHEDNRGSNLIWKFLILSAFEQLLSIVLNFNLISSHIDYLTKIFIINISITIFLMVIILIIIVFYIV